MTSLLRAPRRRWIAAATLALVAIAGSASAQTDSQSRTLWKGTSDAYDIEWTTSNLRVTRSRTGEAVLDAESDANARWAKLIRLSDGTPVKATVTYRLLSAVGPYLSVERSEYCDCGGAHPSAVRRFYAIDLNRSSPGAWMAASLDEVFPSSAISTVLAHDAVVRKALGTATRPKSLTGLLDALENTTARIKDCDYSFSSELMTGFAFYDVRGGTVHVRLGLPSATEVCRGGLVQLGLTLDAPKASQSSLSDAKQQRGGVLMVDAQRIPRSTVTAFEFARRR
jgi:hypothetical protein